MPISSEEPAELPIETKACMDYVVRIFAGRCLRHPRLDEDPVPVIAAERDRILDEIQYGGVKDEKMWTDRLPIKIVHTAGVGAIKQTRNGRKL